MADLSGGKIELLEGASVSDERADIILPGPVRAYDAFTKFLFEASMVVMLTLMTLLIGMDVILRVFFDTPIRGTHDLVGLCMLLLVLLALPHSWRGGYHVRMDMIYGATPKGFRRAVDVFAAITAIVFGLLLAYQAARYIPHFIKVGSSSVTLQVPYWPFTIAIMVSAVLFAISVFIDILMTLFGRRRNAEN
jgi:TRAP-type C4-dicarboxylate transport system permease small subunit